MALFTEEDYEQFATKARHILGLGDQTRLTGTLLLDAAKDRGVIGGYEVLPDAVMTDAGGRFEPNTRIVYLTQSVWNASDAGRALFTVAHEIAHALLGHKNARNRSHALSSADRATPSIRKDERAAERLAAAILAPYDLADFTLNTTSADVANRFGLSRKAAVARREEFARIYRRQHKIERPLPPEVINFLEEAAERGHKIKSLRRRTAPRDTPKASPTQVARRQRGVGDPCFCGWPTLIPIGNEMKCPNCQAVYGRYQDGDTAEI